MMVAVAVLSFGLVLVYQSFFIILDSFDYSRNYLRIAGWMDEKVWQVQDGIMRGTVNATNHEQGEISSGDKNFNWSVSSAVIDPEGNLSSVDLQVTWKNGKRPVVFSRSGYAKYE